MEESCPATPLVLTGRESKSPLQVSVSSPESDGMKSPSRNSPDSHCVICLGRLQNKSFTDSCLHQFCFQCLLQWSKVKPECPLCKQPFKSIIHNVRSNFDYDQYHVGQPHCVLSDLVHTYNFDFIPVEGRFRYRSTMTREYFRELAETFLAHTRRMPDNDSYEIPPMMPVDPAPGISVRRSSRLNATSMPQRSRQRGTSEFRRNIYIQDLWVEDLADVSGRYRTCTPQFYRDNPAQIHRIIPWLNREVNVLLNDYGSHAAYVLSQIVAILPLHPIRSREFRELVEPYFGQRTEHFIHELYTFARSVYDIAGFDQNAVYAPNPNYATEVQEISSSSDDSDIEILETVEREERKSKKHPKKEFSEQSVPEHPKRVLKRAERDENRKSDEPVAGPSGLNTAGTSKSIEICESDSDEIKVLSYVKPEPEIVTLSSGEEVPVYSDLDVSDGEYAETIRKKLTKVNHSSDSADEESYERPKYKPKGGKGKCKSNGFGLKGKQKKNYMKSRKCRSHSSTSNKSINSSRSSSVGSRQRNRSSSSSRSSSSYSSSSTTSISSTSISSSTSNHTSSSIDKTYPRKNKRTRSIPSENYSERKPPSKLKKKKPKVPVSRKKYKKKNDSKETTSKGKRHRSCLNSGSDSEKKVKLKKKVRSCVVVPKVKPCDLSFSSLNSTKCNVSGISSRNSEESEPRKRSHPLTSYWSIALDSKNRDKPRNRRESSSQKKPIKPKRRSDDESSSEEIVSRRSKDSHSSYESSNKSSCERERSTNKKRHNSWSSEENVRESSPICENVNGQNSPSSINSKTKTAFLATSSSSVSRSPAVSRSPEKPYFESD